MKIETLPKPEEITNQRYFQIRDCDKDGCGSFHTFCVSGDTLQEEIYQIACEEQTAAMERKEQMYIPSFFREPPKWRLTIKVVEHQRKIEQLTEPDKNGRTYRNIWTTKPKGLKFTIVNNWIRIKLTNDEIKSANGYAFGKVSS